MAFYIEAYAIIVHTQAIQLIPQLSMEQFHTFPGDFIWPFLRPYMQGAYWSGNLEKKVREIWLFFKVREFCKMDQ